MDQDLLEEVLSCPSLPSLPAVAVEVIELTRDPEVKLERLAQTIETDQGLTAKVLRTVNSSYYGLRQKCSTIRQALVVLGLAAVKSLALGFSLVSAIDSEKEGFDHEDYWRRGLFTAVGARSIAKAAQSPLQDEAFLSGLLQDIGMIAMLEALGSRYIDLVRQTGGDHRKLCRFELADLELQHPDIGAMMAQRWKLPDELVLPVKYHERPSAGPVGAVGDLVRAVGLGGILADAMMSEDPVPHLRRFRAKAKDWLALDQDVLDSVIEEVASGTREMAKLFDIDAGKIPDAEALINSARDQAVEIAIAAPPVRDDDNDEGLDALLLDSPRYDAVTGLVSESAFPKLFHQAFDDAVEASSPLAFARMVLSRVQGSDSELRTSDATKLVVGAATLMRKHFEHQGSIIARLGPMSFAIVMPGAGRTATAKAAEAFRHEFESAAASWGMPTTASIGVAVRTPDTAGTYDRPTVLQAAATQALKAAGASGGNCIKVFTPKKAA
ncbi:MAG: HDOD domain-containing protein [Phycisphaerales bacterium]